MQSQLRLIGEVKTPRIEPLSLISGLPGFRASLRWGINASGMEQQGVADALRIGHGDFSRMLSEARIGARPRNFPADSLPDFMRVTNTLAPLQWLASAMGKDLIDMRVQTLEERVIELESSNAALRAGRAA